MSLRDAILACAGLAVLLGACQINQVECDQACREDWMDGPNRDDSLFVDFPKDTLHRVLNRFRPPAPALLEKPVILAVHGFTASTYEWLDFFKWSQAQMTAGDTVLVSLVLLGGHGRDIEDFRKSTWKDWGRPILAEYDSLVALGYRNISIAGCSTGGSLLLQYLSDGEFAKRAVKPKWFFLIDPIVTPAAKILSLVDFIGPILGNSPQDDLNEIEVHYWYVNRPAEDLAELYHLINRVKNELEDGIALPPGSRAKVWKAKQDGAADPVSILQIYKGLRNSDGGRIHAEMVDSRKHVFTRLTGRNPASVSHADTVLQLRTFSEMAHPDSLIR